MKPTNFGLDPDATMRFEVTLDKSGATIWEVYDERPKVKASIPCCVWNDIADLVKAEFNTRLMKHKQKTGRWSAMTHLDRLLGKELCLLAWVLEDADPALINDIVRNWKGLAPEERWWLFTTTNATSNLPTFGKDRGWRKALRIAFSENS